MLHTVIRYDTRVPVLVQSSTVVSHVASSQVNVCQPCAITLFGNSHGSDCCLQKPNMLQVLRLPFATNTLLVSQTESS